LVGEAQLLPSPLVKALTPSMNNISLKGAFCLKSGLGPILVKLYKGLQALFGQKRKEIHFFSSA